jgi:hypothetical protein
VLRTRSAVFRHEREAQHRSGRARIGERSGSEIISGWLEDSKEAAQIVIETNKALHRACHRASSSKTPRARFEDQQGERSSDSNGGEVDHQLYSRPDSLAGHPIGKRYRRIGGGWNGCDRDEDAY